VLSGDELLAALHRQGGPTRREVAAVVAVARGAGARSEVLDLLERRPANRHQNARQPLGHLPRTIVERAPDADAPHHLAPSRPHQTASAISEPGRPAGAVSITPSVLS